ncbi:MAG: S8 family serine peptidase, partial [Acidimicrobiia bacterium]
ALLGALVLGAATAAPAAAGSDTVTFVVGLDGAGAASALAEAGAEVVETSVRLDAVTVRVPAGRAAAVADRLADAPGIDFVEPDHVVRAQLVPTDTYWPQQWGPRQISAPAAWDATTGASSTVIAVLDTGVDPGPEFDGKLVPGYDFVNDDADPDDDNGHGTSVAAVAAADANDAGVAGICWSCRVMPVKVLGADGSGSSYDIASGISWATERGADVIVMSLGSTNSSTVVAQAVSQARTAGVVLVAAAGNQGTTTPNYPAATPGVIGVAASDQTDSRYSFSNHGSWVDVAAPGCNGAPLTTGYGYFCGTSSATPVAAGAAALAISLGASGAVVEQAITATAVPVGSWVAAGRVDAAALVAAARGPGGGTDSTPVQPEPDDPADDDTPVTVQRTSGDDRIATSLAIARHAYPTGTDTVVLARSDAYADALAAAPLAASLGAPVLLSGGDALRTDVATTIDRLGATSAVLVGGPGALSAALEQQLRDAGLAEVRRIAGSDRFDTARRIALEVGGTRAYVVEGANGSPSRGWPDAVAVSALAAQQGRPILLTTRDAVPAATASAMAQLGTSAVTIVGGTGAVSDAVAQQLSGTATVRRIAGATRYDTSARLAEAAVAAGATGDAVWLATGRSWPDALAAGASAGAAGAVLLLVDGSGLTGSPESAAWLAARPDLRDVVLVGGPSSLSVEVESAVAALD